METTLRMENQGRTLARSWRSSRPTAAIDPDPLLQPLSRPAYTDASETTQKPTGTR